MPRRERVAPRVTSVTAAVAAKMVEAMVMESEAGLKALLGAGVTTFVNLQSRGEGQDYRERALKLNGGLKFVSAHIPDQKTTSDAQVARLVVELYGEPVGDEPVPVMLLPSKRLRRRVAMAEINKSMSERFLAARERAEAELASSQL